MKNNQNGSLLVEILIGIGLLSLLLPILLGNIITSRQGKAQKEQRTQAVLLLKEAEEAVRSIRENGWEVFEINGPGTYHPQVVSGQWALIPNEEVIDSNFTRQIEISNVLRDENGMIVNSGGSIDPSSKQLVITISWESPSAASVDSTIIITRHDNMAYIETTEEHFNAGTSNGTAVINTDGGEVILGSGGQGDWCRPSDFIVDELNLVQEGRARSVEAIEGKAFTGTDTFFSGSFVEIDISNDDPPSATAENSMPGYSTNDVFIEGNYAYVAVDDPFDQHGRDVIIVDLNTDQIVGYFDASGWVGASGIYVRDNIGYVTTGNYIRTFDLSQKTGSRPQLDSIQIESSFFAFLFVRGIKLTVVGDFAYIAISGWSNYEMRLINVSNPNNLTRGARANVNGENGREVFVNETGTRAYLATSHSGSHNEFFIINTDVSSSQKNSSTYNLSTISSFDSSGMDPKGLISVPGNRAILVGTGGEEYQVLDISNETSPTRCGGIHVDTGIYGVSAVLEEDGDAYSYIVTGDGSAEFKIIEGGPGGAYATEGEFESQTYQLGSRIAFNRIFLNYLEPNQTSVRFQVAVSNPPDMNCEVVDFRYIGPDGTPDTFYTEDGIIPLIDDGLGYQNPGACFRYKAFLESEDSYITPMMYDVIVNHSP